MILVTGGTGLVGAHLLYHLTLNDDKICAIYRTESKLEKVKEVFSFYTSEIHKHFSKIEWIPADVRDVTSLENVFSLKITKVYHCAAIISFNPQDYSKMRKTNINGTANIVNFCIENKVEKLCHVSSIAAVEEAPNSPQTDESEDWNFEIKKSGYAITKYGAEMEVWRGSQENLDVVIVNPSIILGSGFWNQGSGTIFSRVANKFPFFTKGITAFVGVEDVVKVMMQLMNSSIKNERFIVNSQNLAFKDVFNEIADNLGVKRPKWKISPFVLEIAWRLDWLKTLITRLPRTLTKQSAKSLSEASYYSSKKVETALNFEFTPIDRVIKKTCVAYKKNYSDFI